jgi:hypothetical protein
MVRPPVWCDSPILELSREFSANLSFYFPRAGESYSGVSAPTFLGHPAFLGDRWRRLALYFGLSVCF